MSVHSPRQIILAYGYFRLLLSVLFTFPLLVTRHLILGPFLPWMPLCSLLLTRYVKAVGSYLRLRLPKVNPEEWVIPSVLWKAMVEGRRGEVVDIVRLPPVKEKYRQGIVVCEGVEAVERPGFMLTPPGSAGQGLEQAKEGERVILYYVGGCVIVSPSSGLEAGLLAEA